MNNINYFDCFYIWLIYATLIAFITQIIAIIHGVKFNKKHTSIHWFHWVGMPVFFIVYFIASCSVLSIKDDYEARLRVIKKIWVRFGKNLLADWSL